MGEYVTAGKWGKGLSISITQSSGCLGGDEVLGDVGFMKSRR
jgi:hypothetical protein